MLKKIGINYSFSVFTLITVIGLPFVVGVEKFNYCIYVFIALIIIYISLYFCVYYYLLDNDKIIKKYLCRVFNSPKELKIKDIDHVEIRRLYAPAAGIIFYKKSAGQKHHIADYMSYSYNDLVIIEYLLRFEIKIVVNVRKEFTKDLQIIRKYLKRT